MLPGGAYEEELEAIDGLDWKQKAEALVSMSLLASKDSNPDLGEHLNPDNPK